MSEAFDPYRQWLGRDGGPPKDFYELLGVARDQTDAGAIARHADALIARIRSIRPGPHIAAWQQLLDALSAAKRCLTDPQARAKYDACLNENNLLGGVAAVAPKNATPAFEENPEQIAFAGVAQAEEAAPPVPSLALLWAEEIYGQGAEYRPPTTAGTPAAWWLLRSLVIVVLFLAAALGGLLWHQYRQGRWPAWASLVGSPPQAETQAEGLSISGGVPAAAFGQGDKSSSARKTEPSRPSDVSSGQSLEPVERPADTLAMANAHTKGPDKTAAGKEGSKTEGPGAGEAAPSAPAKQKHAPLDAQKVHAFRGALSQARAAMARRDLNSARKHLQAAAQQVQGPEDEARVAGLENLLANLEEFWKGMGQVLATLQPAQELTVGATPIIVVSADARSLTYRSEGANRTVTLQDMPGPLVVALAEAGFTKAPSQKVLIAAFLAADGQGDRRRARRLLEEAAQAGEDVQALLAELDHPGPGGPSEKLPPPDDARLQQARQQVRERFQAEFRAATRAPAKTALAQKLIEAAGDATSPPELRYALLAEACDLAVAAGKAGQAFQAIEELDRAFRVDPLALKVAVLERLARTSLGIQSQKEFAETAMKTAAEAMEAQRSEEARKLADLALAVARRSRSPVLLRAVQTGREQLGLGAPERR